MATRKVQQQVSYLVCVRDRSQLTQSPEGNGPGWFVPYNLCLKFDAKWLINAPRPRTQTVPSKLHHLVNVMLKSLTIRQDNHLPPSGKPDRCRKTTKGLPIPLIKVLSLALPTLTPTSRSQFPFETN